MAVAVQEIPGLDQTTAPQAPGESSNIVNFPGAFPETPPPPPYSPPARPITLPSGEGVKTGPYDLRTGQQTIGLEQNKVVVQERGGFQELVEAPDVMLRKVRERLGKRAEKIEFNGDKILVTFGTGQTAEYPVD